MKNQDLNALARTVHQANIKWWQSLETGAPIERNRAELLALVVSEICECLEGERKNLMDDKLTHRKMAEVEMADALIRLLDYAAGFGLILSHVPEGIEIKETATNKGEALFDVMKAVMSAGEFMPPCSDYPSLMASALHETGISYSIAMISRYCEKHSYDLEGAFNEKMAFNAVREDHKHEARALAGGKKF